MPTSAGHALTSAPIGPCPIPCASLALTVATMPPPRLQAASRSTRRYRRLASSTTMDAGPDQSIHRERQQSERSLAMGAHESASIRR